MTQSVNPNLNMSSASSIAPRALKGFKLSWLLYGAAAYYGLRYLSKRGIFPNQTGRAIDMIDRGIDTVKQKVGLGHSDSSVRERSVSDRSIDQRSGIGSDFSSDVNRNLPPDQPGLSH